MDDIMKYKVKKDVQRFLGEDLPDERINAALDALDSVKLEKLQDIDKEIEARLQIPRDALLTRTIPFGFWIGQLKSIGITRDEAVAMLDGVWDLITDLPALIDDEPGDPDDNDDNDDGEDGGAAS